MKKPTIEEIAGFCRSRMELFASDNSYIGDKDTLSCYCAIASMFFYRVSRHFGYKVQIAEGSAFEDTDWRDSANHCWNTFNDKIIDLTATQFNEKLPPVYITSIDDENYEPFRTGKEMRQSFKEEWPEEQNPYTHTKKIKPYIKAAIRDIKVTYDYLAN